jgi:hypothetical protein
VTLAANLPGSVVSLTLGGSNLYFYESIEEPSFGGALVQLPIDGGAAVTFDTPDELGGLAADATHVYWIGPSFALEARAATGGPNVTLAADPYSAQALVVDATRAYWLDGTVQEGIMSVPLGGGTPDTVASFRGPSDTAPLALDATRLYWIDDRGPAVMSIPKSGGEPTTLWTADPSWNAPVVDGLAASESRVVWSVVTTGGGSYLLTMPAAGGSVTTLATGSSGSSLAVDGCTAYWAVGGGLVRISLGGGSVTTLAASGVSGYGGIAADDTSVYWTYQPDIDSLTATSGILKLTPK